MAGGAARSRDPRSRYPHLSRSRERLHREPARPYRRLAEAAGQGDARADQGGRFQRAVAGRPVRLFPEIPRGRPARAVRPHAARRRRCACRARRRCAGARTTNISSSAAAGIPTITGCTPGAPTPRARSISRSACATGRRATISTISSRRPTAAWSGRADCKSFFYVKLDDNHRPMQVWRHKLGTKQADDILIYEEQDSGWFTHLHESASGCFCVIAGGDHETSEQRLIDLANPEAPPRLVAAREEGVQYSIADRGDRALHPHQCRRRHRLQDRHRAAGSARAPANWRDLIPHRRRRLRARRRALRRPSGAAGARQRAAGDRHPRPHDRARSTPSRSTRKPIRSTRWAATSSTPRNLRFAYSSMTTPSEVYDYDMATRTRTLRKRQEIRPATIPPTTSPRASMATSHDGAEVPVSILHRRGLTRDGKAPLLLYGYGSYGMAMPASFAANRLSLVDRGFVYAIAHIRGGADKGWGWYLDGKREKKTNTFDDFAASARALIAREVHRREAHRRPWRLGRRHADGRGRQPRRRAVRGHRRRSAVRRRAQHHARRHAAADAAGMAGMGQPDREREGLPHHPVLLAL